MPADIASFYHLRGESLRDRACAGTACFVARHDDPKRWEDAVGREPRVYCLGKCYASPAAAETSGRPIIGIRSSCSVVLERITNGAARTLSDYVARGGYVALERALLAGPETVIGEVERSGLRGRGGAAFPTGCKLRAVAYQPSDRKFVVMNADEGDPGAYIDRILLEDDPHAALEGFAIAAHAVGAAKGYIYLRREYPAALAALQAALAEARAARIFAGAPGRGAGLDVQIVVGEGSYVCGEETAMLNSIEGRRPFVRSRPPYPSARGLFESPTLVQNVETLVNLPWILRHGGAAYASLGHSGSRGTKLVSLNSLFVRPGLFEVEFGTPVRTIVDDLGGGLRTGALRGVIIGGPLAGVLPPQYLDVPFGFEELRTLGASIGHGGVVAFDEHTSILDLVHHVFSFGAYESCGRCTPCRLGAHHLARMVTREDRAIAWNEAHFEQLVSALRLTSLCGHGTGLAEFADSILRYYREELVTCRA